MMGADMAVRSVVSVCLGDESKLAWVTTWTPPGFSRRPVVRREAVVLDLRAPVESPFCAWSCVVGRLPADLAWRVGSALGLLDDPAGLRRIVRLLRASP